MKKLDFIEALNHLSDETVAEAAADETSKKPDKKPLGTFLKYGAAAACAALAIFLGAALSKNIELEKQMPDVAEQSETTAVLPEVSENGPTTETPASSLPTPIPTARWCRRSCRPLKPLSEKPRSAMRSIRRATFQTSTAETLGGSLKFPRAIRCRFMRGSCEETLSKTA